MPVEATVGKKTYESTKRQHAEEVMFSSTSKYDSGNFTVSLTGWPCTDESHHDCHRLFIRKSAGRTITVVVTEDHGGYARNHGKDFGDTGTITYQNGEVSYS